MNDENNPFSANPNSFDDKPIGKATSFDIPEYGDMPPPTEIVEPVKPPLEKRLQAKLWKVKKEALDELLGIVRDEPLRYQEFERMSLDFVTFSHGGIISRGVLLVTSFLNAGGRLTLEEKVVIKTVVEKCMVSDKADKETKLKCHQILFWYMEQGHQDLLLHELNQTLMTRNPKILGVTMEVIASLLHNFGVKKMDNLELFCRHLNLLSEAAKPLAKPQTVELFKEMYRWIGDHLWDRFKIHHEVKDELIKFTKDYTVVPMEIKRGLPKASKSKEPGPVFYMESEQSQCLEEVDVLAQYPSEWVDTVLEMTKWKEKKEYLDELIKKSKVNKITPNKEIGHFIKLIKRLLGDHNINLLQCGLQITQNLSKGLKKSFRGIGINIVSLVFAKLKDSKAMIVEAAQQTLKCLTGSLTIDDFMEDVRAGLDDKASNMKCQTMRFVQNFTQKREQRIKNHLKTLLDRLVRMGEDGNNQVRKQSVVLLAKIKIAYGWEFVRDKVQKMDKKKQAEIKNARGDVSDDESMEVELPQSRMPELKGLSSTVLQPVKPVQAPNMSRSLSHKSQGRSKTKGNNNIETSSVQSSMMGKASPKNIDFSLINEIASPYQQARLSAYQALAYKYNCNEMKQVIFHIKSKAIMESNSTTLNYIVTIAKKSCSGRQVELETMEFLGKHDWRRAKHLIEKFATTHTLSVAAEQYYQKMADNMFVPRTNSTNSTNNNINAPTTGSQMNIKSFVRELENLLPKMSHHLPDGKISAAKHILDIIDKLPKAQNESELNEKNGWNQQIMDQFFNIVKHRIMDIPEISELYCSVIIQMNLRGLVVRQKGLRVLVTTLFNKYRDGQNHIRILFENVVASHPMYMFSYMLNEVSSDLNGASVLEFILTHNEQFIRHADIRLFISPFMIIISRNSPQSDQTRDRVEKLLDQIVEISGEKVLQEEAKKVRARDAQKYLAKYNIVSKPSPSAFNINNKLERVKRDEENPWTINVTPMDIFKFVDELMSLREPFTILATPMLINEQVKKTLNTQFTGFLRKDYSDMLIKWIYWRTCIEPVDTLKFLLSFECDLVKDLGIILTENELHTILNGLINSMCRFNREILSSVEDVVRTLCSINTDLEEKTFLFLQNFIAESPDYDCPIDQIIAVFFNCYPLKMIRHHLASLAALKPIRENDSFLKFCEEHIDKEVLRANGIRLRSSNRKQAQNKQEQQKGYLSDEGGPQNMIKISPSLKLKYTEDFKRMTSNDMQAYIQNINFSVDKHHLVETHMKILYSIVMPFLRRQITTIIMFSYIREFQRVLSPVNEPPPINSCLRDLFRILVFFLIDLDDHNIEIKGEISKGVNKLILILLETTETRYMLEVLFILLRNEIKVGRSVKLQNLLVKCTSRIVQSSKFNPQHSGYIYSEINKTIQQFNITAQHPLTKSLKNLLRALLKLQQTSSNVVESFKTNQDISPTMAQLTEAAMIDLIDNPIPLVAMPEVKSAKKERPSVQVERMGMGMIAQVASMRKERQPPS